MKVYLIILFLSIPSMGKLECSHMTINQIESFSGYKSGLSIIKTMKKEKIKESSNTFFFNNKRISAKERFESFHRCFRSTQKILQRSPRFITVGILRIQREPYVGQTCKHK